MRGYFGIGIYRPKTEMNIGTLWRSAFLFGASFIFVIGKRYRKQPNDTPNTELHVPLFEYKDWEDFLEHVPHKCEVVCIEMAESSTNLIEASHHERAIYVLGAEDKGIPEEYLEGHQVLTIPTIKPFSLNVATAGSIVMYDRISKQKLTLKEGE